MIVIGKFVLFVLVGRQGRERERVDIRFHQFTQRRMDHALALDPGFTRERLGDDSQAEVTFAAGAGAGVAGVAVRFVLDLEAERLKGLR